VASSIWPLMQDDRHQTNCPEEEGNRFFGGIVAAVD
jgi:hypothetical protein